MTNEFYVKYVSFSDEREGGRCIKCGQKKDKILFNTPYHTVCLCPDCYRDFIETHKAHFTSILTRTTDDKEPIRVFISGPMTGIEDYNFPLFNHVAEVFSKCGYEVVNPVDICKKYKKERVLSDKTVFEAMIAEQQESERTCNAIVLLPGWEYSKGVRLELKTAIEQNMRIIQWGVPIVNQEGDDK